MNRRAIIAALVILGASRGKLQYIKTSKTVDSSDMVNNLPVYSLEVIGWVPRWVKQYYHVGPHKV